MIAKVLLHVPIVLSVVVLAAHFLRYGNYIGVACSLALFALMFLRTAWATRVVQAALVLGALEWGWTLYRLAEMRAAMGESATRMTIIIGSVALVTLISAALFQTRALRSVYGLDSK